MRELEAAFRRLGYSVGYFDGSLALNRFAGRSNLQFQLMNDYARGVFVHAWVDAGVRGQYASLQEAAERAELLETLGVPIVREDLSRWILDANVGGSMSSPDGERVDALVALATEYLQSGNVAYLSELLNHPTLRDSQSTGVVDVSSGLLYLVVAPSEAGTTGLMALNLSGGSAYVRRLSSAELTRDAALDFVRMRDAALVVIP